MKEHETNTNSFARHDPLLTDKECCAILGIAKPTFHKCVARGLIPRPVKLGHLSRWPRSEIIAVIENAKAARHQTKS